MSDRSLCSNPGRSSRTYSFKLPLAASQESDSKLGTWDSRSTAFALARGVGKIWGGVGLCAQPSCARPNSSVSADLPATCYAEPNPVDMPRTSKNRLLDWRRFAQTCEAPMDPGLVGAVQRAAHIRLFHHEASPQLHLGGLRPATCAHSSCSEALWSSITMLSRHCIWRWPAKQLLAPSGQR